MDTIRRGWTPTEAQWSEFFQELLPTHEADSLASTNKEVDFDKIYVLARHYNGIEPPHHVVYYIDLSSASKDQDNPLQPLHPILHWWDGFGHRVYHDYVVVGSKLFMFGGLDDREGNWLGDWCYYDFGSAVYSPKTINIEESSLKKGPPMRGRKHEPVAAVVSDCKICVFATLLYDENAVPSDYPRCGPPNFEVFDTIKWCWTELPEPFESNSDLIHVTSHCIHRSCLIICTDIGIYGINIDDADPKWVKMKGSKKIKGGPFYGRWEMVGKNVCSPFEVARLGEVKVQLYPFAFKHFRSKNPLTPLAGYGVVCVERADDGMNLCIVQGTNVDSPYIPVLLVTIVKFDTKLLENSRCDMWKAIQSEKSFSFEMKYCKCVKTEIIGCFQFKGIDILDSEDKITKKMEQPIGHLSADINTLRLEDRMAEKIKEGQ